MYVILVILMYVPCKSEKNPQKRPGIFHAKDSAMLTADAVVRQTVLQFGKKKVWHLACLT